MALPCPADLNPMATRKREFVAAKPRAGAAMITAYFHDSRSFGKEPSCFVKLPRAGNPDYETVFELARAKLLKKMRRLPDSARQYVETYLVDDKRQWEVDDGGAGVIIFMNTPSVLHFHPL